MGWKKRPERVQLNKRDINQKKNVFIIFVLSQKGFISSSGSQETATRQVVAGGKKCYMLNKYNEMLVGRTSDRAAKGEGWTLTDVMTESVSWTDVHVRDRAGRAQNICSRAQDTFVTMWICARINIVQCAFGPAYFMFNFHL